jgi:hypothetical protein
MSHLPEPERQSLDSVEAQLEIVRRREEWLREAEFPRFLREDVNRRIEAMAEEGFWSATVSTPESIIAHMLLGRMRARGFEVRVTENYVPASGTKGWVSEYGYTEYQIEISWAMKPK